MVQLPRAPRDQELRLSEGDVCKGLKYIAAAEEEYFYNCCLSIGQDKNQTVNWYKEKEGKWALLQEDGRIAMNGIHLEFWPVVLNDTGKYCCNPSNGTPCASWFLDVRRRNNESCFNADLVLTGKTYTVGESYSFKGNDIPPSVTIINKTWYKNCTNIAREDFEIEKLTVGDSGTYTCEELLSRAGKKSYQRKIINLRVEQGSEDVAEPAIIGDGQVLVETEIGKMEVLNCSIFLGSAYKPTFYWRHNESTVKKCQNTSSNVSPCEIEAPPYHKDGKTYVLTQLWFKSIKEEDFNSSYYCTLSHEYDPKSQIFTLRKGHNPDIPLPAFTTGIAMVILFFLLVISVVILCVVFRVDLVLFYRDMTGKDETLGDGKTYDAFVSYLKDCMPMCSEEQAFALDILPQTLEEHFGYKLCIFERDISPGGAVVDDVQSFIDKSRRLIIILSKNYISDKVMFELETGLHKALVEKKIKVIIIEYMPIHDFSFLPKSLELLSSSQVVKWKKDKSLPLNSRFWKKLRCAMPAKSSSETQQLFLHPRTENKHLVHPAYLPG
ncbi:interleukin-18 receptor 1 [Tiliqua scincoides]|uniref:interleukin-18 receptor 1 n=1 Tax=Tiliqua scincoides TaxID=71010 RepID=UPI003461B0F8